jgi:hypothetical protein
LVFNPFFEKKNYIYILERPISEFGP